MSRRGASDLRSDRRPLSSLTLHRRIQATWAIWASAQWPCELGSVCGGPVWRRPRTGGGGSGAAGTDLQPRASGRRRHTCSRVNIFVGATNAALRWGELQSARRPQPATFAAEVVPRLAHVSQHRSNSRRTWHNSTNAGRKHSSEKWDPSPKGCSPEPTLCASRALRCRGADA